MCRRAALLYCRNRKSHNVVWDTSYLASFAAHKHQPKALTKVDQNLDLEEDFEEHNADSVAEALEKGTVTRTTKIMLHLAKINIEMKNQHLLPLNLNLNGNQVYDRSDFQFFFSTKSKWSEKVTLFTF